MNQHETRDQMSHNFKRNGDVLKSTSARATTSWGSTENTERQSITSFFFNLNIEGRMCMLEVN